MLKIFKLLFEKCEVDIRHQPQNGFTAGARGPFAVLALVIVVISLAIILGR
ncbi:MAG TPA: hypothetical protein VG839_07040 [Asticcacaulis sp.]|nr:hypothetical protein [Asticcacaulis sp.]